jgi:FkbM family methyltransferase
MSDLVQDIRRLDAADDYQGMFDHIQREERDADQLVFTIYQLLINQRFRGAYLVAKVLRPRIINPVVLFAQALGGVLFGNAADEADGCAMLQLAVTAITAEQQARFYSTILSKTIPNLVNHFFVHGDTGTLLRLLAILKAGVPRFGAMFDLSAPVAPLNIEDMRRKAQAQAKLISLKGPPPGTPRQERRGVVAVREYFLGAVDPSQSRPCDLGPRTAAAMSAYGWPTRFFGMQFGNPQEDYRGIAALCRETNAEILVLDDNLIENVSARRSRADMIAQLRQDMPGLKIVSVYFDPWMLSPADLIEASAMVDLVWAPFPALPVWNHPTLADKVLAAQFPLGTRFEAAPAPLRPRMSFAGSVMGFNWHRALWLEAAKHAGLAIDRQLSSHKPDGMSALDSYGDYLRRLADATCSFNFSMRQDLQCIVTGRTFETMLSGSLLVQEYSPDMGYYFIAGEHYLEFSSVAELRAIARFLETNREEAEEIRRRGAAFARDQYGDDKIMASLDQLLFPREHGAEAAPVAVGAPDAAATRSFKSLTGADVRIKVIDIGANPINGPAPYESLLRSGEAEVVGFEPNPDALVELQKMKGPNEIYLPHAVGDGRQHVLNLCQAPGMTSLLSPNPQVLNLFRGFPEWGRIVATEKVDTVRLDDVAETSGADFLKMDIQGAELMVLRHAENRLRDALVIQTEVEFLPLYIDQPLFSDIDLFLRDRGFVFHRFFPTVSRMILPLTAGNDPYAGLSQLLWADAIFVRDFTRLDLLSDRQLLGMAAIVQQCYQSIDLALRLLTEYDRRNRTALGSRFLTSIKAQ